MSIETLPSNKLIEMTELFHRAFNAAGCNPMCHCCEKMIPIGDKFKLSTVQPLSCPVYDGDSFSAQEQLKKEGKLDFCSTVAPLWEESKEVMLCAACTPEKFKEKEMKYYKGEVKRIREPEGGCFRVNGKIVH